MTRPDRLLPSSSFDHPALRRLNIGLRVIGDDYAGVPPADALAARGIVRNVHGYSIYGDYSKPNPPAALIDAVASGEVDLAIAWGPLAGFFGAARGLVVTPVEPVQGIPMQFSISMGVRKDDDALRARLNEIVVARAAEIDRLLVDVSDAQAAVSTAAEMASSERMEPRRLSRMPGAGA